MKQVELKGTARELGGKGGVKALRRENKVPCVLYGGKENVHFTVDRLPLERVIHSPLVHSIQVDLDGRKYLALLREKQFHPVSDAVIHADFLEVQPDQTVSVKVSVRLKGQAAGVRQGGVLQHNLRKLRLKGTLDALPELLELDVSGLELGHGIHVRDLNLPGVTILEDADEVVASVKMPRRAVEEQAAAATPEAEAGEAAAAAPAPAAKAE